MTQDIPVRTLCGLFGKTKQAYYKQMRSKARKALQEVIVLEMIQKIRKKALTNRWGGRKLYTLLQDELSGSSIKIGRDKLFDILRENDMLVRPRKQRYYTTQSHHWLRKYENLIENATVSSSNQIWVSDITYVKFNDEVYYLYLITDVYSQKIVGFHICNDLQASSAVEALKMSLRNHQIAKPFSLVHHSDRGVQYCSEEYTEILNNHKVLISMAKPSSPHENAIAERVNGILKEEWLYDLVINEGENPHHRIKGIIEVYNKIRPHNSLGNIAPSQVHDMGFKRHNAERVMGKTYRYRKKAASIKKQPNYSESYAIGPYDYSLASCSPAELASASSWHCKFDNKIEKVIN